jgi:hypothetical protein
MIILLSSFGDLTDFIITLANYFSNREPILCLLDKWPPRDLDASLYHFPAHCTYNCLDLYFIIKLYFICAC